MRRSIIKKAGIILAAILLFATVPPSSFAKNGTATPSEIERDYDETDETYDTDYTVDTDETEEEIYGEEATPSEIKRQNSDVATPSTISKETLEDLTGDWSLDDVTRYSFKENGKGTLILPRHKYNFRYTIDAETLTLDFENDSIDTVTFNYSMVDGNLLLERHEEFGSSYYELHKE